MTNEITRIKVYKKSLAGNNCNNCSHCIRYIDDCKNYYCKVDDEYKYPDTENHRCPFEMEDK